MPRISWMRAAAGIALVAALGLAAAALATLDPRAALASLVLLIVLILGLAVVTYRRTGMLLIRAEHLVAQGARIIDEFELGSKRHGRVAERERDALVELSRGSIVDLQHLTLRAYQEHSDALQESACAIEAMKARIEEIESRLGSMNAPDSGADDGR